MVACDTLSCEMVSLTKFKLSLKARNKNTQKYLLTWNSLLNFVGVELDPYTGLPLMRSVEVAE